MRLNLSKIFVLIGLGAFGAGCDGCKPLDPNSDRAPTATQTPGMPAVGTCGAPTQPCCGQACNPGASCANNVCVAVTPVATTTPAVPVCGAPTQPCCNGTACNPGASCTNNVCVAAQPTGACGGYGQICCVGNTCNNGVGLACGSNGICATANSLPAPTQPNAPSMPGISPCLTTGGQLGTISNGTCVPLPIMAPPNQNAPRFASAYQVGQFINVNNASAFCAGLNHDARTELNQETAPQCVRQGEILYCSRDFKGRNIYWARPAGRTVNADNACEGETPTEPVVYLMVTPTFLQRAGNERANVRQIACEIEQSLGVPSDVASSFATALSQRPYQLHTQPSGEVPWLVTPPTSI